MMSYTSKNHMLTCFQAQGVAVVIFRYRDGSVKEIRVWLVIRERNRNRHKAHLPGKGTGTDLDLDYWSWCVSLICWGGGSGLMLKKSPKAPSLYTAGQPLSHMAVCAHACDQNLTRIIQVFVAHQSELWSVTLNWILGFLRSPNPMAMLRNSYLALFVL